MHFTKLKNLEGPFPKLVLVYLFWIASSALAGSLFEVYFFNLGLTIPEIFLTSLFWFIGGVLLTPLFSKIQSKLFILIGIATALLAVLLLIFFHDPALGYVFRFVLGLTHFFFWIPFNIYYFKHQKNNAAVLGAIYYSIMPILSLILPGFAGFIASSLGYSTLFMVAVLSYSITFLLAYVFLQNQNYNYNIVDSLKSIAGLRSIIFLEGFAANIIVSVTLEAMLLLYIKEPLQFGGFISLVTVFAVIASMITAKLSDKYKNRSMFLAITAVGFAIAAMFTSQSQNIAMFFIGFGMINFFRVMYFPLPLALVVDNSKSLVKSMVAREFMLGIGRIAGAIIGYIIIINSNIQTALLVQGIALLLYVPLLEMKKKKLLRE